MTGLAPIKPAAAYRVVGTDVPRIDLPDKLAPATTLRPRPHPARDGLRPHRAAPVARARRCCRWTRRRPWRCQAWWRSSVTATSSDVVAEREEVALAAVELLRADAEWHEQPTLPDETTGSSVPDLGARRDHGHRRDRLAAAATGVGTLARGALPPALPGPRVDGAVQCDGAGHRRAAARCGCGCGPTARACTCCAESWPGRCRWTRTSVSVQHVEGAGCYGHNGADDVALDAALLALAVPGRPVQVVWSRPDELGWAPFGPAAAVRIAAEVDGDGAVTSWRHDIWGNGHVTRPGFVADGRPARGQPPRRRGADRSRRASRHSSTAAAPAAIPLPGYDFPGLPGGEPPADGDAAADVGAAITRRVRQRVRDRVLHGRTRRGGRPRPGRVPARPAGRPKGPRGGRGGGAASQLGYADWSRSGRGRGFGYARYKNSSAYCAVVAEVEATTRDTGCGG